MASGNLVYPYLGQDWNSVQDALYFWHLLAKFLRKK